MEIFCSPWVKFFTSDEKSLVCLLPKLLSCLINKTVRLSCSVNKLVRREKWTMVLNLAFLRPKHKGQASGSTPGQPLLPSTFQNLVFRGKNCHSVSSVTALTKKEKTLFFFPKQWQPQSKTWQVFIGGHYFRPREVFLFFLLWTSRLVVCKTRFCLFNPTKIEFFT